VGRVINLKRGLLAMAGMLSCGFLACTASGQESADSPIAARIDVSDKELNVSPVAANWPSYNGDYTGRRYSSLDQINLANVNQLRAQWVFHAPNTDRLEVTPVVVNGVMFVTARNDAYALDARTGRTLWHHAHPISQGLIDDASGHINRGVGVWGSRVYMNTDNAHLLCLDARSGHLIWDVAYADWNKNYGATSAPLIVKGKVLVGTSGGDDGVRGFVAAYDAITGKFLWRFWTIPGPGEPGSESWPGDSYLHGGGTTWMPGTYDPELNTLYWGTSNASPDFSAETRPGDDLYTCSLVALDPDTGKLKWHFQFTPHDLYDYDATETAVLVDAEYKGKAHKLILEANRNGFLYVLDRVTGEFLSATRFAEKLNWTKGIDGKGRPIITDDNAKPTPQGTEVCPGFAGATNWYSPSYNPITHTLYFMTLEECTIFSTGPEKFKEGETYYATGGRQAGKQAHKSLLAFDLASGTFSWRYPQAGFHGSNAGTMTSASGLVFFGDNSESFEAIDAKNGKPLWHFNTGQSFHASPMSYAVAGKQYVAIAAGSDIFSFALP
jgi:alcohol dehydrogenase (cytochrome c)